MSNSWLRNLAMNIGNGEKKHDPAILPPMSEAARATLIKTIQEKMHIEMIKCANALQTITKYRMIHFDEGMINNLDMQFLAIMQAVENCRCELRHLYTISQEGK